MFGCWSPQVDRKAELQRGRNSTLNNSGAMSLSTIFEPHGANRSLRISKISTLPKRNCFKLLVKLITASAIALGQANY